MPPLKNLNISFIFTYRKPLPLPCIKDSACSQGHTRGVTHTQTLFYQFLIYSLGAQWAEDDTSKDLGTSPLQPAQKITAMSLTITTHTCSGPKPSYYTWKTGWGNQLKAQFSIQVEQQQQAQALQVCLHVSCFPWEKIINFKRCQLPLVCGWWVSAEALGAGAVTICSPCTQMLQEGSTVAAVLGSSAGVEPPTHLVWAWPSPSLCSTDSDKPRLTKPNTEKVPVWGWADRWKTKLLWSRFLTPRGAGNNESG